ncbi:MAG TPA: amidohydrolase family protein [Acidobacteriota bacterium]|nr:amidohydrolase family protein [Acidobacteriota bacterium]
MSRLVGSFALLVAISCSPSAPEPVPGYRAFVGATLIDGTGAEPKGDAVVVVRDGRIESVGSAAEMEVPPRAEIVDLAGRTLIPGLINAHGHVGDTLGLESGHYSEANVRAHLGLYASYGVTTVVSLGGDGAEGVRVRDAEGLDLRHARLRIAGAVVTAESPEEAHSQVQANADLGADFIKIRVDDNLGTSTKMSPEVYGAVIEAAHSSSLPLAAHLFYLDDAKGLLRAGADFIAHSVRDLPVDEELIGLLLETGVCYSPTLTREVSTYVYESEPEFFADPFFLTHADRSVLDLLRTPEQQQRYRDSPAAPRYKDALRMAQANLKALVDAGVTIAFGTDSGPPARFQGYFEHMETELMAEAGLSPRQILRSATGDAAACVGLDDVGTIETGKWADMVVLSADPMVELANLRAIESVWIAGNRMEP